MHKFKRVFYYHFLLLMEKLFDIRFRIHLIHQNYFIFSALLGKERIHFVEDMDRSYCLIYSSSKGSKCYYLGIAETVTHVFGRVPFLILDLGL